MFSFFFMLSFLFLFISSDDFIVDCICSLHCFLTVCEVPRFCVVVSWVLRIWESVFYAQSFFTLNSFLLLSRLPWDRQFCFEGCRASQGPAVQLWRLRFETQTWPIGLFESHSVRQKVLLGRFNLCVRECYRLLH